MTTIGRGHDHHTHDTCVTAEGHDAHASDEQDGCGSHDADGASVVEGTAVTDGMRRVPVSVADRPAAVRRATLLNRVSLGYNITESVIALGAGIAAGSISLIGFGLDSVVEISASGVLAWRLAAERRDGCTQETDRLATRAIALCFAALAAYVGVDALRRLVAGEEPDTSMLGVALTALSLAVMPFLARAKRRVAPALGSRAQVAEANQTRLCAYMSAVVLAGLLAHLWVGWWWADPLAALAIAALASVEAVRTWRAESLADTCCA